ncbi:anthranilate synthase family protein [Desulfopila aestuarii]|uniref:anthranilate synthase n=1 Tax=Desulfopila aestuarii DSM 18488 TaxID=1121416 RepID=A0A1M7YD10_9BACT|nr:anthranilate synthase family protein [Desulfopila aestuarii]SHO50398.1 phenazine biosynthesis protein phzE [Desulfopila aestuarii DSM 18488]
MQQLLRELYTGSTAFSIIQKQDSDEILILVGESMRCRQIEEIPRSKAPTDGECIYDTISVVPFCQIRERGYTARDDGEEILTIRVNYQEEVDAKTFMQMLPQEKINLAEEIAYDSTEEEYASIIRDIVEKEIGNGEGANFVVPRNASGQIEDFSVAKAMTIFRSLLENDYGTYWKFIFYDTSRFFIGSTPERHLLVQGGRVKMNPISGTFRKDRNWASQKAFKADLLKFLIDQKEINELFMVVDEELKMMARMCDRGGAIVGPLLKEMSRLIHSEYLLAGESDKDIFELFTDSMYAATVVGSPVENACNIIAKYSSSSRRYYGSAMMLIGRDEGGHDFLDSPITIRTAEIDTTGKMYVSVGATLVKDSVPEEEVAETRAKGAAIFASILQPERRDVTPPMLTRLYNDDEIIETMVQRNQNLSNFWFFKQESGGIVQGGQPLSITIIHNEDDFVYMLRHMFTCMGIATTVVRYDEYDLERDSGDITLLGPGPGNPNEADVPKIATNMKIADELLRRQKKALFICLGHQILCKNLGFEVRRKALPLQGSQLRVNLFGREELVGFYNTFAPQAADILPELEKAILPELGELIGVRGSHFVGYQFHPESLLTKNGYTILQETVRYLLAAETSGQ